MKKSSILAMTAVAGLALSGVADVTSANIVGYQTATIPAKTHQVFGVQFTDVSGADQSICVTNLFSGYKPFASSNVNLCDQIWKWNTTEDKWDFYGYRSKTKQTAEGWYKMNWSAKTFTTTLATDADVIKSGEGFYYFNGSANPITVTLSGAVVDLKTVKEIQIPAKAHNVLAFPWPTAVKITDVCSYLTSGSVFASSNVNLCDQIWKWNVTEDKWDFYGYRSKTKQTVEGWFKMNWSAKTFTTNMATDADVIEPGQGFYFFNGGAVDKVFSFTSGMN